MPGGARATGVKSGDSTRFPNVSRISTCTKKGCPAMRFWNSMPPLRATLLFKTASDMASPASTTILVTKITGEPPLSSALSTEKVTFKTPTALKTTPENCATPSTAPRATSPSLTASMPAAVELTCTIDVDGAGAGPWSLNRESLGDSGRPALTAEGSEPVSSWSDWTDCTTSNAMDSVSRQIRSLRPGLTRQARITSVSRPTGRSTVTLTN